MKKVLLVYVHFLLTIFLFFCLSMSIRAASITDGLPLSPLPQDGHNSVLRKLSSLPEGETIIAFDVSEQMGILLITRADATNEKHLRILDTDGGVIAAYSFDCAGSVGVAWDGSDICLFFTRGHIIELIDRNGYIKERFELTNSSYEIDKSWNLLAHRKEKRVNTGIYTLRDRGLSLIEGENDYTELVFIDYDTEKEIVLYDASKTATVKSLAKTVFIIVSLSAIMSSIIVRAKQNKSTSN